MFALPVLPRNRAARCARIAAHRALLPTDAEMVDNILSTFNRATDTEIADGSTWYVRASAIAQDIADEFGISHRAACGIIAALSPQTSWERNVYLARQFAETGDTEHFANALAKSTSILHGVDPLKVLGGRKVRSFFANIFRPNIGGHVTVDRHALSIVLGRNADDATAKVLERIGTYTTVAAAYRTAARSLGIAPQQLQAVTWLVWKRTKSYELPQHASLWQGKSTAVLDEDF